MPDGTQFWKRRGAGASKVILAGLGKLRAWSEHREDLGEFSPTLADLRGTVYGEGILKLHKAWDEKAEKQPESVCAFDHWLVWVLPGSVVLGRVVDSADLAGRKENAFIVLAEITGCPLEVALRRLPSHLDAFTRRCVDLPDREGVRTAFASQQGALESLLVGEPIGPEILEPSAEERAAFLAARGLDAEGVALARLLHKVELSWAPFALRRSGKTTVAGQGGTVLRLPCAPGKLEVSVLLWEEFITSHVLRGTPRCYIVPAAHDWLDVVVGRLEGAHLRGLRLRAGPGGIILETDVPHAVTPELQAKAGAMMSAWRAGEPLQSVDSRTPVAPTPSAAATPAVPKPTNEISPTEAVPAQPKGPGPGKIAIWALPVLAIIAGVFLSRDFIANKGPASPDRRTSTTNVSARSISDSPSDPVTVMTPLIRPTGGSHTEEVPVTLTTTTPGATIRYTIDGTEPTTSSPSYSGPITLRNSATLKAKAFKAGANSSPLASATFAVTPTPTLAAPLVTPNGGTHRESVQVTLACTEPGATINYTLDGTEPSVSSPSYSSPIKVTKSGSVKAKAFKPGSHPSPLASATFTLMPTPMLEAPVITPSGGSHRDSVQVTMMGTNPGATIYYTVDGKDPTNTSAPYRAPFPLTTTTLVKARAFQDGFKPSPMVSNLFTITPTPTLAAPVITPNGGSFNGAVTIQITSTASDADVRYTVDGTEPSNASASYRTPFPLTRTTLVKARAFQDGFKPSPMVSETFTALAITGAPPATTSVPQKGDVTKALREELEALKVWFQLRKNNTTPAVVNPKGYEEMGISPGVPAKPLPLGFDRPTRKRWEQKADDLKKRIEGNKDMSQKEIDSVFRDLRAKIGGAGLPF